MSDKTTPNTRNKSIDSREDRLKAALKANMAKRKAQARARAAVTSEGQPDTGPGERQDKDA